MAEAEAARYYTWSGESRRYRNADSGRYVSRAAVRASLDTVLDTQMERVRGMSADLVNGDLSLDGWRSGMVTSLKIAHLEGAAVARGGWQQITAADYTWISGRLRSELTYLQAFHDDLAYGRIPLDGTVASRAAMYVESGIGTNRAMEGRMAVERGEELEKNIGADDDRSCDGCLEASDQGWVPIGTLVEVGDRDCLTNDRCYMAYRTGRPDDEG